MLKKLIAMTIVTTMLLSSFCIIAQADYGYNWGDVIAKKIGGNSTDNSINQNAGDSVSNKNHRFLGAEAVRDLYFLYNYDESTGNYIRDDAGNSTKADAPYFALDDYYPRIMSNFKTKTFGFKTTGHQGKYFFTKQKGIPTLYLSKKSNVTLNTSSTMTYEFSIKYAQGTEIPLTQFKIYTKSGAAVNFMRINTDGRVTTGSLSYTTAEVAKLEAGKEYNFAFVVQMRKNETDPTKYDAYKTIYLKENNGTDEYKKIYWSSIDTRDSSCSFERIDMEFFPYVDEQITDSNFYTKLTSAVSTDFNNYKKVYNAQTYAAPSADTIKYKYQLKNVDFYIDNFTVYAGDIGAQEAVSSTDGENLKFFVSSSVNTINIPSNQYITVAAQASNDATVTGGKLVVATYDKAGELKGIKTKDLSITKGSISETFEKIERVNQIDSKIKVMFVDDMGTLIPLASSASFVQPTIYQAQ